MLDRVEKVHYRLTYEGKLVMWGQLYVSTTGRTVGGWLVNSWSSFGAPYWTPKLHWLDKTGNKLCHVGLNAQSSMDLDGEDTSIEPDRAKFIRATVDKWEQEWLAEEGKKL